MRRTLIHYWRMNLAVAVGAAVATAVLAGALVVGDSVRSSLRQLTLERLGGVDHALAGQRFFRRGLANEMARLETFQEHFTDVAPAILLRGSAQHADKGTRASQVGLQGIDDDFLRVFTGGDGAENTPAEAQEPVDVAPESPPESGAEEAPADETAAPISDARALADALAEEGMIFPPAVINEPLARTLDAAVGDDLVISLQRWSQVPRGSLLGRKDTGSVVGRLRVRVAAIIADRGVGRFALETHQASSFNIFVPLSTLARTLDQEGTANSLLVRQRDGSDPEAASQVLDTMLRQVLTAEDLGLVVRPQGEVLSLESEEFILGPSLVDAVEDAADELGATPLPVLTYLVNGLSLGERRIPYSTVTALGPLDTGDFGRLPAADGTSVAVPPADGIVLNRWSADALQATVGDRIELDFFTVGPREELEEASTVLTVTGITEIDSLAGDPTLAQEYPGIADTDNMADWDPPFPIELSAIGPEDEDYWDEYRGTPKAFVAADTGRDLWRSRWGDLTAFRLAPAGGALTDGSNQDLAAFEMALLDQLVQRMPLEPSGLVFRPVKSLALGASGGATDFGGLFVGFSFFIILSAALLVALLFGLGVEQRAPQVGLLRAIGYPEKRVRQQLMVEGGIVGAAGALLGLAGAVLYAQGMIHGLRTWWLPAVGTSRLELFVEPSTLAIGYLAAVAVVLLAIWLRIRRLREVPTTSLLARRSQVVETRPGRRAGQVATVALVASAGLVLFALATGQGTNPMLFGGAGFLLLVGLLALFSRWLGGHRRGAGLERGGPLAMARMALTNGARNRGRSLLSATLVASASYMIVTVAAFQQDFTLTELGKDSGTGGFHLMAEADIPIFRDLDDPDGRFELGIAETPELAESTIIPMRLLPGDDTSCLNLYQPTEPRVLGVPRELVDRQAFSFQAATEDLENPWTLLHGDLGDNVIPAIGDFNSTQWILKLKLGDELTLENEAGEPIQLRLVATLATSIFQSELLISDEQFQKHFPSRAGWSSFLVEGADHDATEALTQQLESSLVDYGFDAVHAPEKLEAFHTVQNTYLSTFRTLGGLGLLLGTIGLAIVLLRSALERRGELAAMRAFGFRRASLVRLVVAENALLLLAGLGMGTVAALLTAAPNLATYTAVIPWTAIFGTLVVIFFFGLLACTLAALGALGVALLPALKAEH